MDDRVRQLATIVWDYHHLHHRLLPADIILVLCSHDKAVAARGAQLWLDGWAPHLMFSGGLGGVTRRLWTEPEADQFARVAVAMGVPAETIIIENESTNTGDNVHRSRRVLAQRGLDPDRFILVQKPYMERRTFATFEKVWPGKHLVVTSPQSSFDEYLARYSHAALSVADVIAIMVGDLQRIRLYPALGFQIEQEIPPPVWAAFEELVALGYDTHLAAPHSPIVFRHYQAADRNDCLELFDGNCPEFFAPNERDDYLAFLSAEALDYTVCVVDGRIAGAYGVAAHEGALALRWILFAPAMRGRGLGSQVMARVFDEMQRLGIPDLHIAASHKSAPFFARFGAAELVRTTDGWGPGMDRVDMVLTKERV
jgi:uncharacterized SAM-binding protein YcdF (DUF218 family)/GNAT superfamily N-acetyltransferase